MERTCCFDKQVTDTVKGVLVILMFVLHFFCFPSWYIGEGYSHLLWMKEFQGHFQICVAGFTFLTGYLYFFSNKKSLSHIARKSLYVIIPYWVVFSLLLAIAVITKTYSGSFKFLILEFFALDGTIMVFNWYVRYYLLMIIMLYLSVKFIKNDAILWMMSLIGSLLLYYMVEYVLPENGIVGIFEKFSVYYPITITGYIFAKNRIFEKLDSCINSNKNRIFVAILFIVVIFMQPSWLYSIRVNNIIWQIFRKCLRIVSIPFFLWGLIVISTLNTKKLNCVLQKLGSHSLLMWFVHCVFFNCSKEIFQKILFLPYYPVLVLLWGLVICYFISVLLNNIVVLLTKKAKVLLRI